MGTHKAWDFELTFESYTFHFIYGALVQLVEHFTFNEGVWDSSSQCPTQSGYHGFFG